MTRFEKFVDYLKQQVPRAAEIRISDIRFDPIFLTFCQQNKCGKYNTNWMCPPMTDSMDVWKSKVHQFETGMIFQTDHSVNDINDQDQMKRTEDEFEIILSKIRSYLHSHFERGSYLLFGGGQCKVCKRCSYLEGNPCCRPEDATPSLEACCIDVLGLLESCSMTYKSNSCNISYVGMVLLK